MTDGLSTGKSAKRRRTPQWLRRPGRALSQNTFFAAAMARLAIWYLKLTFHTNKWVVEPEDALDRVQSHLPLITAVWHGQHILLPAIPFHLKASVMISKSLDGEITARVARAFGVKTIRASGGRVAEKTIEKGGIKGFLQMIEALERGETVLQTADIPQGTPRRAGLGIVTLAKRSRRPILPLAVASSRRKVVTKTWDRTTFNLPFGRSAICIGEPIYVAGDASPDEMEAIREQLQGSLNAATKRAYELTGKPE